MPSENSKRRASEDRSSVRVFNPKTGAYESSGEAFDMHFSPDPAAEHLAQVEGAAAPGDRSEEELRGLDPADVGPVITAGGGGGVANVVAASAPGQLGDDDVVIQDAAGSEDFKADSGDRRAAATAGRGTGAARGGNSGS